MVVALRIRLIGLANCRVQRQHPANILNQGIVERAASTLLGRLE